MKNLFRFPNPVNDAAARSVALGVVAMCAVTLVTGWAWLLVPLIYGFLARVLTGPTLSPLGQFATRVSAPRLTSWERYVAGPPKRFAQAIGLAFSGTCALVWLSAGWGAARWVLVPLMAAAALEGGLGFCLGCKAFSLLMRVGLIPASVCEECNDLSGHFAALAKKNI